MGGVVWGLFWICFVFLGFLFLSFEGCLWIVGVGFVKIWLLWKCPIYHN